MNPKFNRVSAGLILLVIAVVAGQGLSYLLAPGSWRSFIAVLPRILSMIAFWGPIVALVAFSFVSIAMRLLGFTSIEEIRKVSIDDTKPAAIFALFGPVIVRIQFLLFVIRP